MITILSTDSPEFQELKAMFIDACNTIKCLAKENEKLKNKRWLTVQEVAELTTYTPATIRAKKDEIGFISNGKNCIFVLSDVEEWMARGYQAPRASYNRKRLSS